MQQLLPASSSTVSRSSLESVSWSGSRRIHLNRQLACAGSYHGAWPGPDDPQQPQARAGSTPIRKAPGGQLASMMQKLRWALECQLERDSDLSFIEYYALARLSEEPDRMLRMSELAAVTNASLSRLSHLVKRLEARGLVRRQPDPANGRYTNAILTDAGYAKLAASAPGDVACVRQLVIDGSAQPSSQALRQPLSASWPRLTHRAGGRSSAEPSVIRRVGGSRTAVPRPAVIAGWLAARRRYWATACQVARTWRAIRRR